MISIETIILFLAAAYVAWGIGANDETMMIVASGTSYSIKRLALIGAVATCIGAFFYGQILEETIGKGILMVQPTTQIGLIIILATATWLTIVSYFGWPISTSHSTVGAVIGYGIYTGGLNWPNISKILLSWLISPIVGFIFSYLLVKIFDRHEIGRSTEPEKDKSNKWVIALIVAALLQEFWQGANNVGNATSFVSVTSEYPLFSRALGGIFLAIGLATLGTRVLGVAGIRITRLPLHAAVGTQIIIVTLNIIGTLWGLPLSGTHLSVSCLIGGGLACKTKINYSVVRSILLYWFLTLPGAAFITILFGNISWIVANLGSLIGYS